jgi:hypothetical protein
LSADLRDGVLHVTIPVSEGARGAAQPGTRTQRGTRSCQVQAPSSSSTLPRALRSPGGAV